tara:strand:+ start:164 stop:598 length:435 start_codon:yes stop_codon:yes gene_type:complete
MPDKGFLDWYVENYEEYKALIKAQDGNPADLANFIEKNGNIRTAETRKFLSDILMGKPKKRGLKKTIGQQSKELSIFGIIQDIMKEQGVSKNKAIDIYCNEIDLKTPRETIRDNEKKGEKLFLEINDHIKKNLGGEKPDFNPEQ